MRFIVVLYFLLLKMFGVVPARRLLEHTVPDSYKEVKPNRIFLRPPAAPLARTHHQPGRGGGGWEQQQLGSDYALS